MSGIAQSMLRRSGAKLTTTSVTDSPIFITLRALVGAGFAIRRKGHVAAHAVLADRDVGTVRRVRLDRAVDARAHRVVLDELEERHQLVDDLTGLRCTLCGARRRPPTSASWLGFDGACRSALGAAAGDPAAATSGTGIGSMASRTRLAAAATLVALLLRAATRPAPRRPRRLAADRPTYGHAIDEHPADVRHRLAADQSAVVEEPLVVAVELLERVVGEDRCVRLLSDREHEGITTSDGTSRRSDEFVVGDALLELLDLGLVDAVAERGVDDDGDRRVRILVHEGHHRLAQLGEAGQRAALGGDVGPVDHDVAGPVG